MPADGGYQYVIVNPSPQLPASQSQLTKQVSPTAELPMYVNHLVRKSVLHDGSDLPFHGEIFDIRCEEADLRVSYVLQFDHALP